eukprot:TRINITY_DN2830_c0_g1_i2.p1 TRINITY_DN2830_c0_g1~~TRINITY_DN2830_c0_g1_i2.p1  ORF type:complete len:166 (-),score=9.52 TRINITY_DN2830_c0_g1_i2:302-799(-)
MCIRDSINAEYGEKTGSHGDGVKDPDRDHVSARAGLRCIAAHQQDAKPSPHSHGLDPHVRTVPNPRVHWRMLCAHSSVFVDLRGSCSPSRHSVGQEPGCLREPRRTMSVEPSLGSAGWGQLASGILPQMCAFWWCISEVRTRMLFWKSLQYLRSCSLALGWCDWL